MSSTISTQDPLYFSSDDEDILSPTNMSNQPRLPIQPLAIPETGEVSVSVEPPTPLCLTPEPHPKHGHPTILDMIQSESEVDLEEEAQDMISPKLEYPVVEKRKPSGISFFRSLSTSYMQAKDLQDVAKGSKTPQRNGGRLSLDVSHLHHGPERVILTPKNSSIFSRSPVFRTFKRSFSNELKSPSFLKHFRKASSDNIARKEESDFKEFIRNQRRSQGIFSPEDYDPMRTKNKLLRYEFRKEEEYIGEVVDNKAQGHGVLLFRGNKFGGLWENGYEYIGCYIWKNGVKYCGFWSQGRRNGEGVEQRKKYTYKGEWVKDQKEGYGVVYTEGGCKYEGTWHEDRQEGYGIEVYKDRSFYAGQFDKGLRSGYGVRVVNPTEELEETFVHTKKKKPFENVSEDDKNTFNIFNLENGNVSNSNKLTIIYEGQWKNDYRHGHGIEKTSKGDVFEGSFKDNKRHGFGVLKNSKGHITYGKWVKNEFKANKRILSGQAQKAAIAAREAASVAQLKAKLAHDRAEGARKCAGAATESHLKALEEYDTAEDRRLDTLNQMKLGNSSINIVVKEAKADPNIYSNAIEQVTKRATDFSKDFKSRLSDMAYLALSPKHSRRNRYHGDGETNSVVSSGASTPIEGFRRRSAARSNSLRNRRSLLLPSNTSSPQLTPKYSSPQLLPKHSSPQLTPHVSSPDFADRIAVNAR